ncbi:hypothetical protein CSW98_05420 [Vibrio sp. HA2012]|uniref:hypothetical protein n=1 Tax=Vibrio sp. HA2012 TaxID=1971595 RepID=UPI000C2CD55B|nr:hypothetical protein [Vibrio sp. HA2012]PJC87341.1 hypothetical protein CSW98_05420 [Vibrio sp. HA2012]
MIVTNASEEIKQDPKACQDKALNHSNGFCSEVNCINKPTHRVLVKQNTTQGEALFVVPLCKEHYDSFQGQIELDDSAEIIPAEIG